jgi:hypothetical protein
LEFQLNYELLPNYIPGDTSKDTHRKHKGKGSNQTVKAPHKSRANKLVQHHEEGNQLHNKIIFNGQKKDRLRIRRKILTKISACDEHDEVYNALREELISEEERFIPEV